MYDENMETDQLKVLVFADGSKTSVFADTDDEAWGVARAIMQKSPSVTVIRVEDY